MSGKMALLFLLATGCRSLPVPGPVDLAKPGWTVRQGQALWRGSGQSAEVAGDLLVATHQDGRSYVQFSKIPFPIITAQSSLRAWQIHFSARNQTRSGNGSPPSRWLWFQLPKCLSLRPPEAPWQFSKVNPENWRLENLLTEELLQGYLATTRRPSRHRVVAGESWRQIAAYYGLSEAALHQANPDLNSRKPQIGQWLLLPPLGTVP